MTEQTVTTKSFLGVPVRGDINGTSPRAEQKPLEELAPLFQAVLDDPLIVEFGWTQYTPFFNDGEPCEFGVQPPWFRTTEDADADPENLQVDYGTHPTLGKIDIGYVGTYPHQTVVEKGYVGDHEATLRSCKALNAAMNSAAFDDVLMNGFGDHAEIVVRRDAIEVETYEHE